MEWYGRGKWTRYYNDQTGEPPWDPPQQQEEATKKMNYVVDDNEVDDGVYKKYYTIINP